MRLLCVAALVGAAAPPAWASPGLQDPANPIKPEPPPPPSPPDPIVGSTAMHGLESIQRHQGTHVNIALGGSITIGVGVDSSTGRAPTVAARIGHMATERVAFTAELANTTLRRRVTGTDGSLGPTRTNLGNNFLVGAQLFIGRVLWVRAGGGLGSFVIEQADDKFKILPSLSGVGGAGLDLVRFKRAAIGLEWMTIGMITRDGVITTTAFMLDVSIE